MVLHQGRTLIIIVSGIAAEDDPKSPPSEDLLKTVLSAPVISVGDHGIASEAVLSVLSDLEREQPLNVNDILVNHGALRYGRGVITIVCNTGYMVLAQRIGNRVEELESEARITRLAQEMFAGVDESTVPTFVPQRDNHAAQRDLADGGPLPTASHVGEDTD